jgi:quercetin dioxygenase-like cupin family protein
MDGKIPAIFDHYTAVPQFYDFDNSPVEVLSDKISRQYVMGGQTMLVKWTFKKGAVVPLHFHPNEQVTWITEGAAQVKSQGKTFIVKAGDVIIFPPFAPHEFVMLEDTIDIDFFTPVRMDWITGSADYLKKK